jgi:signal peptidase
VRRAALLGVLSNVGLLVALAFGAMVVVPAAMGWHQYVILTGSMTGTYDRGSIVFDRPIPTDTLRVGDPITYNPPAGVSAHERVTHRIVKITRRDDGVLVFRTKGDANPAADPWTFQLAKATQDKVVFHIPYAGFVFELLSIRRYRMFLLGIPALLVAFGVIRGLLREARLEAEKQAPGWGDVGPLTSCAEPRTGPPPAAQPSVAVVLPLPPRHESPRPQRRPRASAVPAVAAGPRIPRLHVIQMDERAIH